MQYQMVSTHLGKRKGKKNRFVKEGNVDLLRIASLVSRECCFYLKKHSTIFFCVALSMSCVVGQWLGKSQPSK